MEFKLVSEYKPTGDQPHAIAQLIDGIQSGINHQTLLGLQEVEKRLALPMLFEKVNKPTLILSHNKTLALSYMESLNNFFPIIK